MTTKDIVDTILRMYEPEYNDRKTAIKSVSATLSMKAGDGKPFGRKENERKENVFYIN